MSLSVMMFMSARRLSIIIMKNSDSPALTRATATRLSSSTVTMTTLRTMRVVTRLATTRKSRHHAGTGGAVTHFVLDLRQGAGEEPLT